MGIKIKHIDPKITDLGPNDIIINVKTGNIFYKSEKNLFKLQGDNLNIKNDLINFDANISASQGFFKCPGIGEMTIGSENTLEVFEIDKPALEIGGAIIPTPAPEPQYDLGSLSRPWRDIYLSEGSFKFVKKDKGVGSSKIGTSFIVGDYKFENLKDFSIFTKQNVDDLKQGKTISGSGDLHVIGRAKIDRLLTLNGGLHIIQGGITGSIDGGSF